jgi:hypothetical protein
MFVAPINFVTSFGFVPIFRWEPVEPVAGDSPPPPPVSVDSSSPQVQPQATDNCSPQMRLVFKGFGWAPTVEIATFPRPSWMTGLAASGAEELRDEDGGRLESERRARAVEAARQYAALLAAQIAAASLLDPSAAVAPPSETQEPTQEP